MENAVTGAPLGGAPVRIVAACVRVSNVLGSACLLVVRRALPAWGCTADTRLWWAHGYQVSALQRQLVSRRSISGVCHPPKGPVDPEPTIQVDVLDVLNVLNPHRLSISRVLAAARADSKVLPACTGLASPRPHTQYLWWVWQCQMNTPRAIPGLSIAQAPLHFSWDASHECMSRLFLSGILEY